MQLSHHFRVKSAVLLLVLSVLASLAIGAFRTGFPRPVPRSKVEAYGDRVMRLRAALPARGVIGYVTDPDARPNPRLWQFYQTQYFLAPLLIDLSADHDTVIGNFRSGRVPVEWLAVQHLTVLDELGDGLVILTRSVD